MAGGVARGVAHRPAVRGRARGVVDPGRGAVRGPTEEQHVWAEPRGSARAGVSAASDDWGAHEATTGSAAACCAGPAWPPGDASHGRQEAEVQRPPGAGRAGRTAGAERGDADAGQVHGEALVHGHGEQGLRAGGGGGITRPRFPERRDSTGDI
jgi:hypothetical protein